MESDKVDQSVYELATSIRQRSTLKSTVSHILSAYQSNVDCRFVGLAQNTTATASFLLKQFDGECIISEDIPFESFSSLGEHFERGSDLVSEFENVQSIKNIEGEGYSHIFRLDSFGWLCVVSESIFPPSYLDQLTRVHNQIGEVCSLADDQLDLNDVDVVDVQTDERFHMHRGFQNEHFEQRANVIDFLSNRTNKLLSASDRQGVAQCVCDSISDSVSPDTASMFEYNRGEDVFDQVYSTGTKSLFEERYPPDSFIGKVFDDGSAIFDEFDRSNTFLSHSGCVGSCAFFSIDEYAVLVMANCATNSFSPDDVRIGEYFAKCSNHVFDELRRDTGLENINELANSTSGSTSKDNVTELGVEYIENSLDFPITGVWSYNPVINMLVPEAQSDRASELVGDMPMFGESNSVAWKAYKNSETRVIQDAPEKEETNDPTIQSEVITPIGDFGVLATASLHKENINTIDTQIASTLGSTLESAIESAEIRKQLELLENTVFRALRHNIRNDLGVLEGHFEMISSDVDNEHSLEVIESNIESIKSVVENTRTLRQVIQSGDERVDMKPDTLVNEALQIVPETPDGFEINISTDDGDDKLFCHPHLPYAVGHLIQNSVVHASDTGTGVDVSIRSGENMAIIVVSDDGDGVPDHEISVLGDEESVLEHGSGLGLWIVDRIVDISEGKLSMYNADGTTAEITVDIASSGRS